MVSITYRPRQLAAEQGLIKVGVPDLMARLLAARGVESSETLKNSLADLLPPNTLMHNQKLAKLLADAIAKQQKILVIGDYLRA